MYIHVRAYYILHMYVDSKNREQLHIYLSKLGAGARYIMYLYKIGFFVKIIIILPPPLFFPSPFRYIDNNPRRQSGMQACSDTQSLFNIQQSKREQTKREIPIFLIPPTAPLH